MQKAVAAEEAHRQNNNPSADLEKARQEPEAAAATAPSSSSSSADGPGEHHYYACSHYHYPNPYACPRPVRLEPVEWLAEGIEALKDIVGTLQTLSLIHI